MAPNTRLITKENLPDKITFFKEKTKTTNALRQADLIASHGTENCRWMRGGGTLICSFVLCSSVEF